MIRLGSEKVPIEPVVYMFNEGEQQKGEVAIHVNDFLLRGTVAFEDKVLKKLLDIFVLGEVETGQMVFMGCSLKQNTDGSLVITQQLALQDGKKLDPEVGKGRDNTELLNRKEQKIFRLVVG